MSTAKTLNIRKLTILAVFTAIEIIFCFTPLGSITLGPGIVATLAHIPALIIAVLLDRKSSAFMGFVMGLCSLIWWSTIGIGFPAAFAFTPFAPFGNIMSLIIVLIPRILFPLVANWLFNTFKSKIKVAPAAAFASVVAAFVHSALVLSLIFVSFVGNSSLSEQVGDSYIKFIIGWGGINAVMEIIVAGIVCGAVSYPLIRIYNRK